MIEELLDGASQRSIRRLWQGAKLHKPMLTMVKHEVLQFITRNNSDACWIETGTYKGQTTQFLSTLCDQVFTCEPSPELFEHATEFLSGNSNVTVKQGTSEQWLPEFLSELYPANVNILLDSHYSGFGTDGSDNDMFPLTYCGENDPPVLAELDIISNYIEGVNRMSIIIDDFRCFTQEHKVAGYPDADEFVNWARYNGFHWNVIQDMFILKNYRG